MSADEIQPNGESEELAPLLYEDLRALAASYFRGQRADHTLQPTALVHEAYVRMADTTRSQWQSESHFLAVAARAMRQVLVDHARSRGALKRNAGGERVTLDLAPDQGTDHFVDLLALEEALEALGKLDERKARVVELRLFGGLTVEQVAQVMSASEATVNRDWRMARAWISNALEPEEPA